MGMDNATPTLATIGLGHDHLGVDEHDGSDAGRTLLKRIASIMDAFDDGARGLTLVELSHRSKIPKSTVHRLAEQLRALGWLERDHSGYRVGLRLFELGGLARQRTLLRDTAFPHLYALSNKMGLAVQLGVLDRGDVVYLERVLVGNYQLPTRIGGRMPSHCTALGKAMLAFDDAAAEAVIEVGLEQRTPRTITDADKLRETLARVRQSGVALDLGEGHEGIASVAAPIRNSGRAIGAVSVTGPVALMDWEAAVAAVRGAAVNIWAARFNSVRSSWADDDGHERRRATPA
jgi:DNA-binding IclR family transcriptional regulator